MFLHYYMDVFALRSTPDILQKVSISYFHYKFWKLFKARHCLKVTTPEFHTR